MEENILIFPYQYINIPFYKNIDIVDIRKGNIKKDLLRLNDNFNNKYDIIYADLRGLKNTEIEYSNFYQNNKSICKNTSEIYLLKVINLLKNNGIAYIDIDLPLNKTIVDKLKELNIVDFKNKLVLKKGNKDYKEDKTNEFIEYNNSLLNELNKEKEKESAEIVSKAFDTKDIFEGSENTSNNVKSDDNVNTKNIKTTNKRRSTNKDNKDNKPIKRKRGRPKKVKE